MTEKTNSWTKCECGMTLRVGEPCPVCTEEAVQISAEEFAQTIQKNFPGFMQKMQGLAQQKPAFRTMSTKEWCRHLGSFMK